ncbi:MAG: hypothetical protein LC772_08535, partial [Chloroflexi bacterium]|nr:hypothetical protein [Chloroflexota bacterium]
GRLARRCAAAGVPLIAIGGSVQGDARHMLDHGAAAVLSAARDPAAGLPDGPSAARLLRLSASSVCRLLDLGISLAAAGGAGN